MFFAVLAGILLFGFGIFLAVRGLKEKNAEQERVEEEERKAAADPNEDH